MKKVLLFVAVLSAFSFASCKKDYTCTCTTVYDTATWPAGTPNTVTTTTIKDKKKDAKSACEKLSSSVAGNYAMTCAI